jgi:hypothetical protein
MMTHYVNLISMHVSINETQKNVANFTSKIFFRAFLLNMSITSQLFRRSCH